MNSDGSSAGPGHAQPHDLLAAAAIGIARLDSDGRIADANPRMAALLGRSARELARVRWEDLIHPHDTERTQALLQELWSGERPDLYVDQRVMRLDKSWLWLSLTVAPILDAVGRVESLVASAQEITARKLGDEALRRSELRFRRLIEKLPAAAYTVDREGLITYHNDRAVSLWGRAPKLHHPDDRYCGALELYSPDGAPLAHEQCWMVRALREGKDFHGKEVLIGRPDGSRVSVLAHASPIRSDSGEVIGAMNVLVDISDHKRSELMRIGSELCFTRFMENLRGLAWIKDLEGRYLFMNAAAEQALACAPSSLIGRTDDEIFPPPVAARFHESDRKVLATGAPCERIESLDLADGIHEWMISKFPIPTPDGGSPRVGGIAIDVTDGMLSRDALLAARSEGR